MRGNQAAGTKKPALHGHKEKLTRKSISSAKADIGSLDRIWVMIVMSVQEMTQRVVSSGKKC